LRILLVTAAGGLILAGCEAIATDKNAATKVTREQCIALLPDKPQVKACMVKLSAQNKAEIAVLDKKIEEGRSTNEVLTRLNEVAREEFEK